MSVSRIPAALRAMAERSGHLAREIIQDDLGSLKTPADIRKTCFRVGFFLTAYSVVSALKILRSPDDIMNFTHKGLNALGSWSIDNEAGFEFREFTDEAYYAHAAKDPTFGRFGGLRDELRTIIHGIFIAVGITMTYIQTAGTWIGTPKEELAETLRPLWRVPKTAPFPAKVPRLRAAAWTVFYTGILLLAPLFSSWVGNAEVRPKKPKTTSWDPTNYERGDICMNVVTSGFSTRLFIAPLWAKTGNIAIRGSSHLYYAIGGPFSSAQPGSGWRMVMKEFFSLDGIQNPGEIRSKILFAKMPQVKEAWNGLRAGNRFFQLALMAGAACLVYQGIQSLSRMRREESNNVLADGALVGFGSVAVLGLGSLLLTPLTRIPLNCFSAMSHFIPAFLNPARLGFLAAMTVVGGTIGLGIGYFSRFAQGFSNANSYLVKSGALNYIGPIPNRAVFILWSTLSQQPITTAAIFMWGQGGIYQPFEMAWSRFQMINMKYLEIAQKYRLSANQKEERKQAGRLAEKEEELITAIDELIKMRSLQKLSEDQLERLLALEEAKREIHLVRATFQLPYSEFSTR